MEAIGVFVTAPTEEEALRISGALVDEGFAACVNILSSIRSIYRWKGERCDDQEVLMVMKTRRERFQALERRIREIHPYEVPEIIAFPIVEGSADYLNWVVESTRG